MVANAGLGKGDDLIILTRNCLDTTSGSQALSDIETIENRNPNAQNVDARFQREGEEAAGCGQQPPPPPPAADCTDPVDIPDDVLRQNLRDALNQPEGDITCADLRILKALRVTGIENDGNEILDYARNFEGLQFATNLTSLFIGSNSFPEGRLNPVANLRNLTELGLFSDFNQAPDLSALSNLTNLNEFSLSTRPEGSDYNGPLELDDLSVFSNFTELTELRFGDVAVTDVSPLSNLTNLTVLEISNSQGDGSLSNIEPLASLTKLEELDVRSNRIQDIEPLKDLVNLNRLVLSSNGVRDLTPLVNNEQLGDGDDTIDLYGNCLNVNEEVNSQARSAVETIEARNPAVTNVLVDLNNPEDNNFFCGNP